MLHLREREIATKSGVALSDETADEASAQVAAAVDKLIAAGVKAHGDVGTADKVIHLTDRPVLIVR